MYPHEMLTMGWRFTVVQPSLKNVLVVKQLVETQHKLCSEVGAMRGCRFLVPPRFGPDVFFTSQCEEDGLANL